MMQKRFWLSGFLWAAMQRSSQRMERCMASFMRAWSGEVVTMTSSSCMMMSEPMEFWREMECSGVRSLKDVSGYDIVEWSHRDRIHGCAVVRT